MQGIRPHPSILARSDLRIAEDAKRFARNDYARKAIKEKAPRGLVMSVFGLSATDYDRLKGQVSSEVGA